MSIAFLLLTFRHCLLIVTILTPNHLSLFCGPGYCLQQPFHDEIFSCGFMLYSWFAFVSLDLNLDSMNESVLESRRVPELKRTRLKFRSIKKCTSQDKQYYRGKRSLRYRLSVD